MANYSNMRKPVNGADAPLDAPEAFNHPRRPDILNPNYERERPNIPVTPNRQGFPTIPTNPTQPSLPQSPSGQELPATDTGYLVVFATTARNAIPIENALVTISSVDPNGVSELLFTTRTNKSGRTVKLPLPAPPRSNSLVPGMKDPYARYTVSVDRDGYYPVISTNLSVFADVVATLPIYLTPIDEASISDITSPTMNSVPTHRLYPKE